MRYLKNKILRAQAQYQEPEPKPTVSKLRRLHVSSVVKDEPIKIEEINIKFEEMQPRKRAKAPIGETLTPMKSLCTKNIVKNYGKAICNFAISPTSKEYLNDILKKDRMKISVEDFLAHLNQKKDSIDSIQSLKELLIVHDNDSEKLKAYKELFKKIGEVFIKYFSVSWIFNGRLTYKDAHLKFRNKMLRRLQHPELFTHIKAFSRR